MSLQSELKINIHRWRFNDLASIERAMNDAYSSIQSVDDIDTADSFLEDFDRLKKEVKDLSDDINSFSSNVSRLQSEMKAKESSAEEK